MKDEEKEQSDMSSEQVNAYIDRIAELLEAKQPQTVDEAIEIVRNAKIGK